MSFVVSDFDAISDFTDDSWNRVKDTFVPLTWKEKILLVYKDLKSKDDFPKIEFMPTKTSRMALKFKELGNDFYRARNLIEALKQYTMNVALALPDSLDLAVAYANRSAAFFELKSYKACLVDINRAIGMNYPEDKISKLISRKKKCKKELNNNLQNWNTSKITVTNDDTYMEYLKHQSKEFDFDENATDLNYQEKFYLPKVNFKNSVVPFASDQVKIMYKPDSNVGRHIVAVKNIQPGEELSIEEPYASVLKIELRNSHCSNCFVRSESMIPCNNCSLALYCSKTCRDNAFDRYHRTECKMLWNVQNLRIPPNVWLAMRAFLIATKQGKDLDMLMDHPIYKTPFKKLQSVCIETFDPFDYIHIHNLESNLEKRSQKSLHSRCVVTSLFLHMLKTFEFFNGCYKKNVQEMGANLTEKELYAGTLLLKMILSMECNMKGIYESCKTMESNSSRGTSEFGKKNIGWGLYSFHSAFNHSCHGNASFYFHKNTIVCCSNQSIKAGEQICVSYVGQYYNVPRNERQEFLSKHFFFNCCCEACSKNWPLSKYLDDLKPKRSSQDRHLSFLLRFRMMPEKPSLDRFYSAKTLGFYRELLTILEDDAAKQTTDFVQCQTAIDQIFSSRANYYELPRDKILFSWGY